MERKKPLTTPTLSAALLAALLLAGPAAADPPTSRSPSTQSAGQDASTGSASSRDPAPGGGGREDPPAKADGVPDDAGGAPPRLEIRRRSGLEPPDRASMADWHRRYVRLAAPVKESLGSVLEAQGGHLPQRAVPHCRRLVREVERFRRRAREERLLPMADVAADLHLKRLYRRLEEAGRACAAERWAATEEHLRQAGLAFRQASLALGRWGVEP